MSCKYTRGSSINIHAFAHWFNLPQCCKSQIDTCVYAYTHAHKHILKNDTNMESEMQIAWCDHPCLFVSRWTGSVQDTLPCRQPAKMAMWTSSNCFWNIVWTWRLRYVLYPAPKPTLVTFGCFFPLKFIAFGTGHTIICCGLTTDLKPLRSGLFVVQTPQAEVFVVRETSWS